MLRSTSANTNSLQALFFAECKLPFCVVEARRCLANTRFGKAVERVFFCFVFQSRYEKGEVEEVERVFSCRTIMRLLAVDQTPVMQTIKLV